MDGSHSSLHAARSLPLAFFVFAFASFLILPLSTHTGQIHSPSGA